MRTLEQIKSEMDEIQSAREQLAKQTEELYHSYEKLNEEYYNLKYSYEPSLEAICAIEDWNKIPLNLHKKLIKYLDVVHPYIYSSGYHPSTGQIAFSITADENPGVDYSKIEYLFTLIRPDSKNRKYINILDSMCNGVWILVSDTNGISIEKTVYGRTSTIKKFLSVGDALNWIYINLFVKDDKDED